MFNITVCVQLTKTGLEFAFKLVATRKHALCFTENAEIPPLLDLNIFFLFSMQVVGLTLSQGLDELALIYLATIQAIAVSHFKESAFYKSMKDLKELYSVSYCRLIMPSCKTDF